MKKILLFIMILLSVFILYGCNNKEVKINLIIGVRSQEIIKNYDEVLLKEDIEVINQEDILGIYYDQEYTKEYNNEKLIEEITLYVKVVEGSRFYMTQELEDSILNSFFSMYKMEIKPEDILYYFGIYNDIHIVYLYDRMALRGELENQGIDKLYYYKNNSLARGAFNLQSMFDKKYLTFQEYLKIVRTAARIYEETFDYGRGA